MKLFLSGFSAFEYWTALRLGAQPRFKPARAVTLEQCAHTNRDVLAFAQRPDMGQLSWPIDVLIPQTANNLKTSLVIPHRRPVQLPKGAFHSAGRNLYVSSPELCFLQLARDVPLHDLALIGFELCGMYALDLRNDCALVPCSPKAANATTSVLRASQTRACDLLWREHGVAIEYDSSAHHKGKENIDRDARRRNQLVSNGLAILTITKQQARDFFAMESVASDVRELLGRRARPRSRDARVRQWKLHRTLFGTSESPALRVRARRQPLPHLESASKKAPSADS